MIVTAKCSVSTVITMTTSASSFNGKIPSGLVLLPMMVSVICSVWCSLSSSASVDEIGHLPAGLAIWQINQFELYRVNPPLVKMVAAAPVVFMDPVTDWSYAKPHPGSRNEYELGRIFVEQNPGRVVRFFQAARLACLPFVLLGCWICYRWASETYGKQAGLSAASLWCFSPLILGHGSLITPDVAAASCGVLAVYRFRAWLICPEWMNAALLGICTGIALLTKFTWAPLFPVIGVFGWSVWKLPIIDRESGWRVVWRDSAQLALSGCIALLLINALYDFDRSFMRLGDYEFVSQDLNGGTDSDGGDASHVARGRNTPRNRFADTWLASIPVPLPACYLEGIDLQRRDFEPGRMGRSYLIGVWKQGGWWYYYIVGLLVKEPVGFLILLCVSATLWKRDVWRRWGCQSLEVSGSAETETPTFTFPAIREDLLLLIPPALVFWLVSRETGFNHHARYIIPALPFLFVFTSRIMIHAVSWPVLRWVVCGLMIWQLASVLWFAPHWLSYFNEIAGGPERGDEWLVDSNIDWGQDLLKLKSWQEQHPEATPLFTLLGSRYDPAAVGVKVSMPEFIQQNAERNEILPEPGWYAVSVNLLQPYRARLYAPRTMRVNMSRVRWFRDQKPVDRAGYSIRIYHVPETNHDN